MAHGKYCLIVCGDRRLRKLIYEWPKKKGIGDDDCYTLALPGGVKFFASENPSHRELAFIALGLYMGLGVETIIEINHCDCKAYVETFISLQNEKRFHIDQMQKAANLISCRYPAVKFEMSLGEKKPDNTFEIPDSWPIKLLR